MTRAQRFASLSGHALCSCPCASYCCCMHPLLGLIVRATVTDLVVVT